MTIQPLPAAVYYTNNPIYVTITDIPLSTMKITFSVAVFTESTSTYIKPIEVYTNGRTEVVIDIAKLVKLYLPKEPHNTNYTTLDPILINNDFRRVNLVFSSYDYDGMLVDSKSITKKFLRGGKKQYTSNVSVKSGYLIPTDKIPFWASFPIDAYYLNQDSNLEKSNVIPDDAKERMDVKGCNGLYFKFKNSLGGYSYWMFENFNLESQTRNLGYIENRNDFTDLGNEYLGTISAISKVPRRYYPLISDLIVSPEIYIYINADMGSGIILQHDLGGSRWERVISNNNKIQENNLNAVERFSLKFDRVNNYNASLIW